MTEIPVGNVTIGDLYREIVSLRSEVGQALGRLSAIETHSTEADRGQADHESRLRVLESRVPGDLSDRVTQLERVRYKLGGAGALAGLLAGVGGSWFGYLITHK